MFHGQKRNKKKKNKKKLAIFTILNSELYLIQRVYPNMSCIKSSLSICFLKSDQKKMICMWKNDFSSYIIGNTFKITIHQWNDLVKMISQLSTGWKRSMSNPKIKKFPL